MNIEKSKTLILKKHVNTIHCSNQFTLIQRKLFNALLFNAYNQLHNVNIQSFDISAKALCELIGYNSNDYEKLRKDLLILMSTIIHWDVINPKLNKSSFEEITIIDIDTNKEIDEVLAQWLSKHSEDDILFLKSKNIWEAYRIKNVKREVERKIIRHTSDIENTLNTINLLSDTLRQESIDEIKRILAKNKIFERYQWGACPALGGVVFSKGVCTYEYSNIMRELLHHPEYYGRVEMEVQAKFKSIYGLVLYENCIRYQSLPYTSWLTIDQFRLLMGVKPGIYSIFRDLQTRVINKSIQEVNLYSSLEISVELKKTGRNVSGIRFKITDKKQTHTVNGDDDLESPIAMDVKLKSYGVTKNKIESWKVNYSEVYIQEKISIVENSPIFKAGKVRNIASLLDKAIIEDYQESKSSKKLVKPKIKTDNTKELIHERKLNEKYRLYKKEKIIKTYDLLKDVDKENIKLKFEDSIRDKNLHVYRNYLACSKDIAHVNISPYFTSFLIDDLNAYSAYIKKEILSFEEFIKTLVDQEGRALP